MPADYPDNLSGHYQSARQMHLNPPDILHSDLSVVVFQEVHSLSDRLQHFLSRHPQQRGGLSEMPGNQRFQSRHCRMPDQHRGRPPGKGRGGGARAQRRYQQTDDRESSIKSPLLFYVSPDNLLIRKILRPCLIIICFVPDLFFFVVTVFDVYFVDSIGVGAVCVPFQQASVSGTKI